MKPFRFYMFLLPFLFQGFVYSQVSDFKLSDYKLPRLDRKSLETNFNITGNNDYYKRSTDLYSSKNTSDQYSGSFSINYNHYVSNERIQRYSDVYGYFNSGFYVYKLDEVIQSKNNSVTPIFNLSRVNRYYFSNIRFIESDIYVHGLYQRYYNYFYNSSFTLPISDLRQEHTGMLQLPLKYGVGRIEQVQDARHALYLFDHLSRIDRITKNENGDEVIEFASLISTLKNKRFFDSRIRRMEEIESVDSFLLAKNYVLKHDARYFTTLGDYWDYGNSPVRYSGSRISFAILPGVFYTHFDENNISYFPDENFSRQYSVYAFLVNAGIEYTKEKPINLYWQNSIGVYGFVGTVEGKINYLSENDKQTLRVPNIQAGFTHTIGFYPNTRTDASFGYEVRYIKLFDKYNVDKKIAGLDGMGVNTAAHIAVNYYISPKFRLNLSGDLNYIWENSKSSSVLTFESIQQSSLFISNISNFRIARYGFKVNSISSSFQLALIYSIF